MFGTILQVSIYNIILANNGIVIKLSEICCWVLPCWLSWLLLLRRKLFLPTSRPPFYPPNSLPAAFPLPLFHWTPFLRRFSNIGKIGKKERHLHSHISMWMVVALFTCNLSQNTTDFTQLRHQENTGIGAAIILLMMPKRTPWKCSLLFCCWLLHTWEM